jgi:hypothetical protein
LQNDTIPLCQWGTGSQFKQAAVDLHLDAEDITITAVGGHAANSCSQLTPGSG